MEKGLHFALVAIVTILPACGERNQVTSQIPDQDFQAEPTSDSAPPPTPLSVESLTDTAQQYDSMDSIASVLPTLAISGDVKATDVAVLRSGTFHLEVTDGRACISHIRTDGDTSSVCTERGQTSGYLDLIVGTGTRSTDVDGLAIMTDRSVEVTVESKVADGEWTSCVLTGINVDQLRALACAPSRASAIRYTVTLPSGQRYSAAVELGS
jgi:hypothetical protein